ncbi:hypothetical protein, partial [Campylobacter hyointestinalis]|uniref:hypothetical protein n=1 Tax=Campylobacter hyointestinalis TaxID=198 RepID=UPI000D4A858D
KPQLLNEVYNLLNGKRLNNELLDKASLIKWNFKGFEHKNALKEMKSQDLSVEQKAKQYAKFLSEAKEPTQVAPDELYKAYNKAKKDLNKPKSK